MKDVLQRVGVRVTADFWTPLGFANLQIAQVLPETSLSTGRVHPSPQDVSVNFFTVGNLCSLSVPFQAVK